jgi:hypothetical protein
MVTVRRETLAVILPIVDIGLACGGVDTLADSGEVITRLRAVLSDGAADGAPRTGPRQQLRLATSPIHTAGVVRFLSSLVRALAEDRRFRTLEGFPNTLSNSVGDRSAAVGDMRDQVRQD